MTEAASDRGGGEGGVGRREGELPAQSRVAVVVLDWDGGAEAVRAVESALATRYPRLEVVLVDNASAHPVLERVREAHPEVLTFRNPRNLGYAGGNNAGIRLALERGADFVLLLNNDARLHPEAILELVAVARRDQSIAAVGAKVLSAERPGHLWMAYGEVSWRQSLVRLVGRGERDGPRFSIEREVDWVSGCALLLSRRGLDEVGLLDEDFFAYHEEVDWCARARARGLRVVFAPRAIAYHRGEASSGGGAYVSRKQYLAARNAVLFVRRHGSRRQRIRFASSVIASLPFQLLRRTLRGEQRGVWLKVRGMLDALRGRPIPRAELGLDR